MYLVLIWPIDTLITLSLFSSIGESGKGGFWAFLNKRVVVAILGRLTRSLDIGVRKGLG